MIGAIVGGVGELFIDLLVHDEEAKRAAKAAVWAGAGAVGVLDAGTSTGVALAAAAAGTMMATQGVAAGVKDANGKAVVDTVGSVVAGGMTSWLALAKTSGGAVVGAAAGGAADGADGAVKGMNLGASLMKGSWAESGAKLAGGAAGAGIGALAAEGEDRAQAVEMGMKVGIAVGGAAGAAGATDGMAAENIELEGKAEDIAEKVGTIGKYGSQEAFEAALVAEAKKGIADEIDSMKRGAVVALASEAAAPLVAAAVHDDGERGRNFLDTWSEVRGVTGSVAAGVSRADAVGKVEKLEASELVSLGKAASDLGTAGVELGFVYLDRTERRRAAAKANDGRGKRSTEPTGAEQREQALGLARKSVDLGEELWRKRDRV